MGYRTSHFIVIYDKHEELEIDSDLLAQVQDKVNEITGYNEDDLNVYGEKSGPPIKWVNYEQDIAKISKCFPDLYFFIEGCGDEHGDLWSCVWNDGLFVANWYFSEIPTFKDLMENHKL